MLNVLIVQWSAFLTLVLNTAMLSVIMPSVLTLNVVMRRVIC
jgi:hypothetical protein